MSTFKRLLNVGKGKAKTASRDIGDAVKPGEWVETVRHAAADAAEAVAEVIRPEDRPADEAEVVSDLGARAARPTEPAAADPTEPEPEVEDAEEVKAKIEQAAGTPKKRTL